MKQDKHGRAAARRLTAGYEMGGLTKPEGYARGGTVDGDCNCSGGEQPQPGPASGEFDAPPAAAGKVRAVGLGFKRGGRVKEGGKEDVAEDRAAAKKRGMSMRTWEKSDTDKKQDAEGLARGGRPSRRQMGAIKRKDASRGAPTMPIPGRSPSPMAAMEPDADGSEGATQFKRGGRAKKR